MNHAPFTAHLREAIAINRDRADAWAALSHGRTRVLSRLLVASEMATLPFAWWVERQAKRSGPGMVEMLGRCFVAMRDLPPVVRVAPADAPAMLRAARADATERWRRSVDTARANHAPDAVVAHSKRLLRDLDDASGILCMRRHLLESSARVAFVMQHIPRNHRGRFVMWDLLQRHGLGLCVAERLDDLALPLQREGLPFLAHDLPAIPHDPDDIGPGAQ
jgi:hypothetical protein